jgi:leucyl aminopeptidase (aminopeptidase T)
VNENSADFEALISACRHALEKNMGLREQERVVVVTDPGQKLIGEAFEAAAFRVTSKVRMIEIPLASRSGEEPPEEAALMMSSSDVVLLATTHSISWTQARQKATWAGARVASMPGITPEIILRTLISDYGPIRDRVGHVCDLLDKGERARIATTAGTQLSLSIAGRTAHGRKGGIYQSPGHWGNLPCGEAFVAPVESTAEGLYVVDASVSNIGALHTPIRIAVRDGMAVDIQGGPEAQQLASLLNEIGDPLAYNIAELGIGCNPGARVSGITLEDEKSLGTCHLALGSNAFFGGRVRTSVHLDGVLRNPSLWIDDREIMTEGRPRFD